MYGLVKWAAKCALHIYCAGIKENGQFPPDAPVIIAANHSNSFFDAIVLGALAKRPLHFLARGDVFKNKWARPILKALHMIPIYRLSEGKENLGKNEATFNQCIDVLKMGGAILIFSEGICINEHGLRPLKKGTARLAYLAWAEHQLNDLQLQPVGINYSSFNTFPKLVVINYGNPIRRPIKELQEATFTKTSTSELAKNLESLVARQPVTSTYRMNKGKSGVYLTALAFPAALGFLTHRPIYFFIKKAARKFTAKSVFYDSVLFGLLFIIYPLLVVVVAIFLAIFFKNALFLLLLFVLPFLAWCYTRWNAITKQNF